MVLCPTAILDYIIPQGRCQGRWRKRHRLGTSLPGNAFGRYGPQLLYTGCSRSPATICSVQRCTHYQRVHCGQRRDLFLGLLRSSGALFRHFCRFLCPQRETLTLLASRQHPQQAYRSCLGLLRLASRYGAERLEAACRRALPAGIHSYKGIKNILDAKLDQVDPEEPAPVAPTVHENIRGHTYYG